jgi:uncharacterized protein
MPPSATSGFVGSCGFALPVPGSFVASTPGVARRSMSTPRTQAAHVNVTSPRRRRRSSTCALNSPAESCTHVSGTVATASLLRPGTRVVISGGTGFVGRALVTRLLQEQAVVVVLARDALSANHDLRGSGAFVVSYDATEPGPVNDEIARQISTADAVINLAGAPIEKGRWTPARKVELWDSRVVGTAKLARAARKSPEFDGVFVTASAVGFYGTSATETFTEDSPPGGDFLAKLASAWENAAWRYTRTAPHVRTVVLRFGVVLGSNGGALQKMSTAFRAFLGGPPGGGSQWFSWVHRDDLVSLIVESIADPKWTGVYNCTAPNPVQLATFCDELARVLQRPNWLPVPAFAVQAALGSEAAQLVLAGQRVLCRHTIETGFVFEHPNIRDALNNIVQGGKESLRATRTTNIQ